MTVEKQLIDKVESIRTTLNEISVYNLDVKTSLELYYELAKKVNEVINELSRFEGVVSDEVIKQNEKLIYLLGEGLKVQVGLKIDELIKNGTIQDLINNKIFNDLNNKIDSFKQEVNEKFNAFKSESNINILSYGAIGDKINDDTQSLKQALTKGRYITAKGDLHYLITDEIIIPQYVTLDFQNAFVTLKGKNARFTLSKYSTLKNVKINIDKDTILNKSVIYLDGKTIFDVGHGETPVIENILIEQEQGGEGYKMNTGLHLDCNQRVVNDRYVISGLLVNNYRANRLKNQILLSCSSKEGNTSKCYITSNTFTNISGFNNTNFIKEDIITGNQASIESNFYENLNFQPADGLETHYLILEGNRSSFINANFWDNTRPTNKNQIIINGNYNSIKDGALPPYPSEYIQNNGKYNTIVGTTYGIPSNYSTSFIAERTIGKRFNNATCPIKFNTYTSVAEKKSSLISSNNDTVFINQPLSLADLMEGYTTIDIKAFGLVNSDTCDRKIWIKMGDSWLCGGIIENKYASKFIVDGKVSIRKYSTYTDINACISINLGEYQNSFVTYKKITDNTTNINLSLTCATSIDQSMTCKYGEVNIVTPI